MEGTEDRNAAIWESAEVVDTWVAAAGERDAKRLAQWQLMAHLLPFEEDDAFLAADLGAGIGAAARAILATYPKARVILTDFSSKMIEEGTRALQTYEGRFEYVRFDMEHEEWPPGLPSGLDAVVTSMCVHHLSDERKQALFGEIHGHLAPGGWYLNYDPVRADDPVVEEAWRRAGDRLDPEAAHKREHLSPLEQARHENHVRHMVPLERQVGFLRAAGFEAVDVFWKHLENVIYGGRRPPASG
ncbi:MAG: class I SAM-dependent methyltransferase [Acidimicrobiales bacterium]|nr:class I SAM-dependent methyltransferase [Acidimicrobiales bacterium]